MYGKNERKCEVWHSPFPSQTKTHLTNDSGLIIIHSLLKHINPYYLSAALFSIPFASFSSISAMQLEWPTHTIMQKKSSEIVSYCFIRAFFLSRSASPSAHMFLGACWLAKIMILVSTICCTHTSLAPDFARVVCVDPTTHRLWGPAQSK